MLISEEVQIFVKCLKSVNAKWALATEANRIYQARLTIIGRPLFIYCSWYFVTNWLDGRVDKPGIRISRMSYRHRVSSWCCSITMACEYSITWLVYLYCLIWLCGLCPVLPANSSSGANAGLNNDFSLLFEYRKFLAKYLSKNNCTMHHSIFKFKKLVFDYQVWEKEQDLANNVANFLTSMWRFKNSENFSLVENEPTMYSLVRSNILTSQYVYGSAICFEGRRFMKRNRFCPYAYRDKTAKNRTRVFDLGAKHDYLNKTPEFLWWEIGRKKGLENRLKSDIEYYDTNLMHVNASDLRESDQFLNVTRRFVTSNDSVWTTPYYDCFGGKTWVLTYLAPFYDGLNKFL